LYSAFTFALISSYEKDISGVAVEQNWASFIESNRESASRRLLAAGGSEGMKKKTCGYREKRQISNGGGLRA